MVSNHHSMVLMSLCVMKQYYQDNYHKMPENYDGKKFNNIGPWSQT